MLFTRESQYLTGLIVCELAQAAHFEMDARKPRHEQEPASQPARHKGAGKEGLPLGDKVSKRQRGERWHKKGTVDLNLSRVVKE